MKDVILKLQPGERGFPQEPRNPTMILVRHSNPKQDYVWIGNSDGPCFATIDAARLRKLLDVR